MRYAPDLIREREMRWLSRHFLAVTAAGLLLPALIEMALVGGWSGAVRGLLWGGFVRMFFVHHFTYSVNSVCHYFGRRRFDLPDESRNVGWLAVPTLGEAWHHNHHAFPTSAKHGLRWYELDVQGSIIHLMGRLGLAWDIVRIPRERQRQMEIGVAAPDPSGETWTPARRTG
jgi:stearoyl-CoA desaturase (delta-9 desaturase)